MAPYKKPIIPKINNGTFCFKGLFNVRKYIKKLKDKVIKAPLDPVFAIVCNKNGINKIKRYLIFLNCLGFSIIKYTMMSNEIDDDSPIIFALLPNRDCLSICPKSTPI